MWVFEHAGHTSATPHAVWRVLRDLDDWSAWDTSMDWVRLQDPFGVGARVVMKPKGQDPITSVILAAVEDTLYADETSLGDVTLRFSHALEALEPGRTRIVHRLEISGPAADQLGPQLGPAITQDFPEAMEALIARAAR